MSLYPKPSLPGGETLSREILSCFEELMLSAASDKAWVKMMISPIRINARVWGGV
jgi:hypothetical protein